MIKSSTIKKKLPSFVEWLSARGAQILEPTNEWEILRFKSGNETSVIYRNKQENIRFCGESHKAWESFKNGKSWRASPSTKRKSVSPVIGTLLKRDGDLCFFCQNKLGDSVTAEHLVAVTHNGTNHISNLVLSHELCNQKAGHLSAMEKIRIHVNAVLRNLNENTKQTQSGRVKECSSKQ